MVFLFLLPDWQGRQFVLLMRLVPVRSKATRIEVPAAQAGALKRATSGWAVAETTGMLPLTRGVTR